MSGKESNAMITPKEASSIFKTPESNVIKVRSKEKVGFF